GAALEDAPVEEGPVSSVVFEEVGPPRDVGRARSSALPPPSDDPFTILVSTLADVAIGAGSPHIASLLPGLLFDARLPTSLDEATAAALRDVEAGDGAEVTAEFVGIPEAWRAILRGTSHDFDACGAAMLDEWAASLLASLLETPGKVP